MIAAMKPCLCVFRSHSYLEQRLQVKEGREPGRRGHRTYSRQSSEQVSLISGLTKYRPT